MITASAVRFDPESRVRRKGRASRSTSVTTSRRTSVPNRFACASKEIRGPGHRRCGVILRDVASGDLTPRMARRLTGFGTTIFTEMTRLAVEHGAINLAQGFPDFDGPDFVKEAAITAIRDGRGQ